MSETQGENKPAPAAQAPKKEKKVLDEETKRKYAEIAAQKKAEAQAKRKAEAEARKAQGIKKKEAVKKDTSQLLGIEAKKEECFSEWYSQVITRAELLDYYDVSGIHLFELYFLLSVFILSSSYLHHIFILSSLHLLPIFSLSSPYLHSISHPFSLCIFSVHCPSTLTVCVLCSLLTCAVAKSNGNSIGDSYCRNTHSHTPTTKKGRKKKCEGKRWVRESGEMIQKDCSTHVSL